MNALLLVDIQNDFLPAGPLAVPEGDQIIPVANAMMPQFDLVVATKDWHPRNHCSFAANHEGHSVGETIEHDGLQQILWPVHCVQNTPGAEFPKSLDAKRIDHVVLKGVDCNIDSYSGFFDNGRRQSTGLGDFLTSNNVRRIVIMGLATDYCVKYTALDARSLGFETTLLKDGCRGVEINEGDVRAALTEMRLAGVHVTTSDALSEPHS
ncbi:MAG: bifunctional nicotinamidase/pyrazinamidase [Phycisphaerales bacterium]|nr:bifunctional nicotinamidase/pyrazinamidase [Phycisphaerales bacterium]MCB9856336.1 bifunctional nicotinamidase/pyrazinamidase [Phycisphaerales bacterium]MCB9864008.1 bifunctional nicotinamidase/pyrazinamidase [Phycisphaerales bacterium]